MKNQFNQSAAAASRKSRVLIKPVLTLLMLSLFFTDSWGQNQQRKWFQNSKDVNFTTNPPTVSTTSGVTYETSAWQKATNGLHDQNYTRIFNVNGVSLYSPQFAGGLSIFPNGNFDMIGPEIAIFPKPGSCDSFYVFYSRQNYHFYAGSGFGAYDLNYFLIDKNVLSDPNYYGIVENAPIFNYNFLPVAPLTVPLAVSKEKNIGGVKTRQLFYSQWTGTYYTIKRLDITYNSISAPVTVYAQSDGLNLRSFEFELSPDGSKLALSRSRFDMTGTQDPTKDVVIYHLNANGTLNTSLGTGGVTYADIPHSAGYAEYVIGLEFSPNSQRLFASVANEAIWYIENLNTTPTATSMGSSTQNYTFSQMEAVNNAGADYIAVALDETNVSKISGVNNPSTPSISTFYSSTYVPKHIFFPLNVNGATNKNLLCLPDQVDGDNYTGSSGGWFDPNNSTKCCMNYYANPSGNNYTVTTSQTWTPGTNPFGTAQPVFDGTLTINPGVTLTLQGITLRFQPNARMSIKQTAQVNLYGSTLTGLSCGQMWQGVRVYGTSTGTQTIASQGILNLAASGVRSKIENAWCGVALYDKEGDPNATTTTGGIVQGAFTDFLNNWKDIEFRNYTSNSSASNVRYCTFIVDNNYLTTTYSHRVTLKNNFGIRFWACTFANDKTSFQTSSNTMEGISAEDAGFTVDRYNGAGSPLFRNFLVAVRAKYLTTQRTFTCKYATFNNNFYGILSEAVNNFTTTNNTFNIGTNTNFFYNVGLFVNVGTGFTIQLNNFQGVGNSTFPWSTGCYIFNSGQNSNLVYKNTYNQLWEANGAENINRASSDDIGLFYQCNTQSQDLLDMYIVGGSLTGQNYGIRENHFTSTLVGGIPKTVSPNNTFSQNSSVYAGHQWNDIYLDNTTNINDNILYRYNTANSLSNPIWHTTYNPPSVTKFVDVQAAEVTNNTCGSGGGGSSLIAGGGSYGSNSEAYSAAKSSYETASYLYNALIDNGNTELLKQSIDVWGQDAWALRNQLLAKSPNLSSEAIEYTAKEGVLPSALLFDVCFANIAAVKDAKFLEMLQSSDVPNPLSSYMIQILEQADEPNSYRKVLEGALNNSIIDFNFASNNMIADYLSDTTDKSDSVQAIVAALPHTSSRYQLAELKLSEGETAEATAIVNGLETANPDIDKEDPNFPLYRDFINFLATNRHALTNGETLPSDVRGSLESIATDINHPGFVIANNILRADGNWTFLPVPKFPDGSYKKEFAVTEKVQLVPPTGVTLNVFPNPAKDYLTLELTYLASSPLTAEVIDYTGKVVSATTIEPSKTGMSVSNINVQQLPTGTFAITIKEGDRKIISKTFTKAK